METFKNEIEKINPSWSKDLIIRYIIVELAPYFQRDLYYFLSPSEKQLELFNSGYRPVAPNVFCVTLCENYQRILERFDIRSKVIQSSGVNGNVVPLFALIVEGDNGWYYLNPLKDLWSHQLKLHSNEYGTIGYNNKDYVLKRYPFLQTLAPEYIAEIDQEIGLEDNCRFFEPDVIGGKNLSSYRIRKGLDSHSPIVETIIAKINDISKKYLNIGAVHGPIERNLMYKYFATTVFTKPEKSLIKIGMAPDMQYAISIDVARGDEAISFYEAKDENGLYSIKQR